MAIKLIFADVDGTLVTSDRRVTERTRAAFALARRLGALVTLATGRTYASALPFAQAVGANAPLVLYNGARVQDEAGAVLREWLLAPGLARVVLEEVARAEVHVSLYREDAIYIAAWNERARQSAAKDGVELVPVGDLGRVLDRAPVKLMLIGEPETMDALRPALLSAFERRALSPPALVRSEPTYLEVLHAEASKGNAARYVAESLGVACSEIVSFGDNLNDLDLIRMAGIGVAMENGHAELKRAAGRIAPGNDEDGVARVLESLLGT
ncbi:MAG: HAD family phosphatase [Myxococcales bacterium]|nr:HAD family phosphatase [Myxococcales bacterium]